jgi:hypothetical protein
MWEVEDKKKKAITSIKYGTWYTSTNKSPAAPKKKAPMTEVPIGRMVLMRYETDSMWDKLGGWTKTIENALLYASLSEAKKKASVLESQLGEDIDVIMNYGREEEEIVSPTDEGRRYYTSEPHRDFNNGGDMDSHYAPKKPVYIPPPSPQSIYQGMNIGQHYITRNQSIVKKVAGGRFELVEKGGGYDDVDSTRTHNKMPMGVACYFLPADKSSGFERGGVYGEGMDIIREYYGYTNIKPSANKKQPTQSKGSKVAVTHNLTYKPSKRQLLKRKIAS